MGRLFLGLIICLAVGLSLVEGGKSRPCCPQYWTLRGNRCYRFVGKSLDWHAAQGYCKGLDHKANLVSLGTKGEAEFIHHLFAEKSGGLYNHYWMGLNDINKEGHYVWTGINRPMAYSNWNYHQPDNHGHREHCGEVVTLSGRWNDIPCSDRQPFICERPRPGSQ